MILSAVSLFKKLDMTTPLFAELGEEREENGIKYSSVTYNGHAVSDGTTRIYAEFGKPAIGDKHAAVLLLPDAGKRNNLELMNFFIEKGYAVLMPDYSGKMQTDDESVPCTVYPQSLAYANYAVAGGLDDLDGKEADETCWFEWLHVAMYSIEYLKSREDITSIGVVGIRIGGEIAWKTMLSPDVKCGVPVNAVGWRAYRETNKFGESVETNMKDNKHRYIAGVESQSYAPFVKCPVLLLCSLRDGFVDADRAYDTYQRIGVTDGSLICYSVDAGPCIGPKTIGDLDLFLGKHLLGREIYIPSALNVSLKEEDGKIKIDLEGDDEAILSELGIYYAEAETATRSIFRDWQRLVEIDGKQVKAGKYTHYVEPYEGAECVFVYAYAKYFNGIRLCSKIAAKKLAAPNKNAVKTRVLYSGEAVYSFIVAENKEYSIGDIFLEREALPKRKMGYGDIYGVYSVGGVKTYKISSPCYLPDENAILKFDAYADEDTEFIVEIESAGIERRVYQFAMEIKGGGKWKKIILKPNDFKEIITSAPLDSFAGGSSLSFLSENEDVEFAITNILWL